MKPSKLCLLALLVPALAACSSSKSVSKEDVAKQAQTRFDALARSRGAARFPTITCAKDLEAKKGATTRCSATSRGKTLGITVTVRSVDGSTVRMTFRGDKHVTTAK